MLYSRRKRLEKITAAEAAGESFWTTKFDKTIRAKIVLVARDLSEASFRGETFLTSARQQIMLDEGRFFLHDQYLQPPDDMLQFIMTASDELMPTVIEALSQAFANPQMVQQTRNWGASEVFDGLIEVVLREHRVAFELIDHEMVEFSSQAMHVDVVAPALRLLASDARWTATERAFRDALGELADGKPGDAITDAATALQELLQTLGATGNALGPLIKSARAQGLFAAHDSPMVDALERVSHWVSADRSNKGDAHTSAAPSQDDAWFIVHVVGALLLRLTAAPSRN